MKNFVHARNAILKSWPIIKEECLSVLGSELHYQAMIYHVLRTSASVPASQIGMNVKMMVRNPKSGLFQELTDKRHPDFRGGFEPIPDVVLFSDEIKSDWRRRNNNKTLVHMLAAIEVKASERFNARLRPKEIIKDIEKLAAHRQEVRHLGSDFIPVMMVIDSAPDSSERMKESAIQSSLEVANSMGVEFMYASKELEINTMSADIQQG